MGPYGLIRAFPFGYNTFFSFILIYVTNHMIVKPTLYLKKT